MKFGLFEHDDAGSPPPGKSYHQAADGSLAKVTNGALIRSQYQTVECEALAQLHAFLGGLTPDYHLTAGIADRNEALVLPIAQAEDACAIARSNAHLAFQPGAGLMCIDSDGRNGENFSFDDVLAALVGAVPAMADYACLHSSSSSSNVTLGVTSTGLKGAHSFFHVLDASDIPRALVALHERMILTGYERHKLSSTGAFLARSWVDQALKVPSQPIYLRAACVPPVTQDKQWQLRPGTEVLDTAKFIPDLSANERKRLRKMLADAEAGLKPEMDRVRGEYVSSRAEDIAKRQGISIKAARKVVESAMNGQTLFREFELHTAQGVVTVGQILADPARWHGVNCADPLEAEYAGGRSVARLYSNQRPPLVHSFAHSGGDKGTKYELCALPAVPTLPAAVGDGATPATATPVVLSGSAHVRTAREFLSAMYPSGTLANWQDTFYRWRGARWDEALPDEIRHEVYLWLDTCLVESPRGPKSARPSGKWVNEILLALRALTERDGRATFGWQGKPQIENVMACQNGLLCLDSLKLHPHTPDLFNTVSIDAPWEPNAPAFEASGFGRWLTSSVTYPDGTGADQLDMLQEAFGYFISGDTNLQKMFLITGPKRSGKGTMGRLLTNLLSGSVSTISSTALQSSFPMQDLIGKSVAVLPDVRIDQNTKQAQLAETLLSISGEDHQTVARKFKTAWSGKLGVRFLLMSNSVPRLRDADGVLFSRFQFLHFPNSNFGKEDSHLTEKLWLDRAVMLRWAVEGYQRLRSTGRFTASATHQRLLDQALVRMDPVGSFASKYLEVTGSPTDQIPMDDLHAVFHSFACQHNILSYTSVGFGKVFWGKDLTDVHPARGYRAVLGGSRKVRVRVACGVRWRHAWTSEQLADLRMEAREDENEGGFLGVEHA